MNEETGKQMVEEKAITERAGALAAPAHFSPAVSIKIFNSRFHLILPPQRLGNPQIEGMF